MEAKTEAGKCTGAQGSEVVNRIRMASRLFTSLTEFAKRQRMQVDEVLATLDLDGWRMLAGLAGEKGDYTPSADTKIVVAELVRHSQQRTCMGCGLRQAEREATRSGRAGTEVCEQCWRAANGGCSRTPSQAGVVA